jgi:hypothetical protein
MCLATENVLHMYVCLCASPVPEFLGSVFAKKAQNARFRTPLPKGACGAPERLCLQGLCAELRRFSLQDPLLQLCTHARSFVPHLHVSDYKSLWGTCPMDMSVYKSFLLHLEMYGSKKIFSVSFQTVMFVSFVKIQVRNAEANRNKPKNLFFGSMIQPENQPKESEFRFLSVQTKNIFFRFERHPISAQLQLQAEHI